MVVKSQIKAHQLHTHGLLIKRKRFDGLRFWLSCLKATFVIAAILTHWGKSPNKEWLQAGGSLLDYHRDIRLMGLPWQQGQGTSVKSFAKLQKKEGEKGYFSKQG